MLIVLSPAKTLDFTSPSKTSKHTQPAFIDRSAELVDTLKRYSPAQIASLMGISDTLAHLNADRFASWSPVFTPENSKQAILAFNGDVYEGLDASSLTVKQLGYAQTHIRILSGLYGLLRPLDLMQPYRLEMGTSLSTDRGRNLYQFWGGAITSALNESISENKAKALVNLASEEYFKSVQAKDLEAPVITPVFEDWKGGRYKVISFHAKRARGLMARFAAQNSVTNAEELKAFNTEGYAFDEGQSSDVRWVFRRKSAA
ncbi:MAG: peroxide stress protein YaaA [Burkholderiaceae bacterium]